MRQSAPAKRIGWSWVEERTTRRGYSSSNMRYEGARAATEGRKGGGRKEGRREGGEAEEVQVVRLHQRLSSRRAISLPLPLFFVSPLPVPPPLPSLPSTAAVKRSDIQDSEVIYRVTMVVRVYILLTIFSTLNLITFYHIPSDLFFGEYQRALTSAFPPGH